MLMHEKVMTSQFYTQKTVACAGRLAAKKCRETEFVVMESYHVSCFFQEFVDQSMIPTRGIVFLKSINPPRMLGTERFGLYS